MNLCTFNDQVEIIFGTSKYFLEGSCRRCFEAVKFDNEFLHGAQAFELVCFFSNGSEAYWEVFLGARIGTHIYATPTCHWVSKTLEVEKL